MDNNEIFNTTLSTYYNRIRSMCSDADCSDSEFARGFFEEGCILN